MPETKVPERIPCIEDIVQFGSLNGETQCVKLHRGPNASLSAHL